MNSAMWGTLIVELIAILIAMFGVFLDSKGFPNFGRYCGNTWIILTFVVNAWFVQFGFTRLGTMNGLYALEATVEISFCFIILLILCFRQFKPLTTAVSLACTFSVVLQAFSLVYWAHGTAQNFSKPLSHFDA